MTVVWCEESSQTRVKELESTDRRVEVCGLEGRAGMGWDGVRGVGDTREAPGVGGVCRKGRHRCVLFVCAYVDMCVSMCLCVCMCA